MSELKDNVTRIMTKSFQKIMKQKNCNAFYFSKMKNDDNFEYGTSRNLKVPVLMHLLEQHLRKFLSYLDLAPFKITETKFSAHRKHAINCCFV